MNRRWAVGAAMAALASISAGCTRTCTEVGCFDRLGIKVEADDGTWTAGAYEVVVVANHLAADGGTTLTCSFTWPPSGDGPWTTLCGAVSVEMRALDTANEFTQQIEVMAVTSTVSVT